MTTIRLDASMSKNPGRNAGWTATWGGGRPNITGQGATQAEARAALAAAIDTALLAILDGQPAFARDDDNGGVWVAVPAFDGGSHLWRVTDEDARQCGSGCHPPAEAFTRSAGMTIVPAR